MIFRILSGKNRLVPEKYCAARGRLSPDGQQLYDRMAEAVAERKRSVVVKSMPFDEMEEAIWAVFRDQPFLYDVDRGNIQCARSALESRVTWSFRLSDDEAKKTDQRLSSALYDVVRRMKTADSLLEREKMIHDLLACELQISPVRNESKRNWEHHSIVGPLLRRQTVCEGMAQLFRLLCVMQQIPCEMIIGDGTDSTGEAGPHAWNLVTLGQYALHVDAYWDLCQYAPGHGICYDYFNLSDQMAGRDHSWDRAVYPACCEERFSYFLAEQCDVYDERGLEALVERMYRSGTKRFAVRLKAPMDMKKCSRIVEKWYFRNRGGNMNMLVNRQQQVIRYHIEEA